MQFSSFPNGKARPCRAGLETPPASAIALPALLIVLSAVLSVALRLPVALLSAAVLPVLFSAHGLLPPLELECKTSIPKARKIMQRFLFLRSYPSLLPFVLV